MIPLLLGTNLEWALALRSTMHVMGSLLVGLLAAAVAGCAPVEAPEPAVDSDAVTVRLQGVVVRQYRGAERRFEVRTARMRLREQDESLRAEGGVQGVLDPVLWREESR